MPKKHENAPKWSDEELRIASDFQQFVAMHEDTEEEQLREKNWYIKKCDRVVSTFVSFYKNKYPVLQGREYYVYSDLPPGVKSAASHLAALARQKKELTRRMQRAKEELALEWKTNQANLGFLIAHADPDMLDELLAHPPQKEDD